MFSGRSGILQALPGVPMRLRDFRLDLHHLADLLRKWFCWRTPRAVCGRATLTAGAAVEQLLGGRA